MSTNSFLCSVNAVVPLVGTWIEINASGQRERWAIVVPLVGTWIEIQIYQSVFSPPWSFPSWERGLKYVETRKENNERIVVPLVGTWIEILQTPTPDGISPSFPSWERGLKLFTSFWYYAWNVSFPSWERGLKSLWRIGPGMISTSFPSWERGLKSLQTPMTDCIFLVVPLVGTWIEIA